MGLSLIRIRTRDEGDAWALLQGAEARVLEGDWETTGALLEHAVPLLREGRLSLGEPRTLDGSELLSPVTHPCRVIAQATNYGDHAREVGLDPAARGNVLFRKSSASLSPPRGAILRPSHVRLLDYEVELGLVIGVRVRGPMRIDDAQLPDLIGALVLTNDVSARDVQIPDGQFYKGKSYRTFTPCGPVLYVPEREELSRWRELRLELRVNGEVRQSAACGEMIHAPAQTLGELSALEDLDPGDLVLTGTPGGVALAPPSRLVQALAGFLPERAKWNLFVTGQAKRPAYLQLGDRVTASIRLPDGTLDLGTQDLRVEAAPAVAF